MWHTFPIKSTTQKSLLELLDIKIKEQHWSINEVCYLYHTKNETFL